MARQSKKMTHIRESRELAVTGLNETELMERDMRNWTKGVIVTMWLKDSIAWMEAAVLMNDSSIRNRPEGQPVEHNRLNVAHVATGYAYELLMKSIAKADDVDINPVHSTGEVFAELGDERQREIRKAMAKHGIENTEQYLAEVNERMCHKDRKYWMIGKDMWSATGGVFSDVVSGGRLSIDRLAQIHQEIVPIGWQALEEWEKIHSKERGAIIQTLRGRRSR